MRIALYLAVAAAVLIVTATADMPIGFYTAVNNQGPHRDVLTVKNYDTGATMTEAYTDAEHLDRSTQVKAGSYNSMSDQPPGGGFLEASISSNVIGNAHIAWQSVDPMPDSKGRHTVLGRSIEDLTGVFSIEKFIQLWSGRQPGEISTDWLPCC